MSPQVLIIAPQSTHPTILGTQVRLNHMIRHLAEDLEWSVDYFCPQGLLRRTAWEENMDRLETIYIPKHLPTSEASGEGQIFQLRNVRNALQGGLLHGIVRDIRESIGRFRTRRTPQPPQPGFRLLSHHRQTDSSASEAASSTAYHPSPISRRLKRYDPPFYSDSLREVLNRRRYDAIIVTYVWMSPMIQWLFDQPDKPLIICDTIDVQYVREARLEAFREQNGFDYESEKRLELDLLKKFDIILAITSADEQELRREIPDTPVCPVLIEVTVPGRRKLSREIFKERSRHQIYDLVFLGADNEANLYAALTLLRDVVPEILKHKPDLKVGIAGKICGNHAIKELADHAVHIKLCHYVESLENFMDEGRILAAPIVAGGGVKVKILEAMAQGLPVITSTLGVEGIDFENGVHGLIADSTETFVKLSLELLDDPDRRQTLAIAAQQMVLDQHSPERIYRDFDEIMARKLNLKTNG